MVSRTLLVLSRASLISALRTSACFASVSLGLVSPARCLYNPASALPSSCRFHVFPRTILRTRLAHGSFFLLACALPNAVRVALVFVASIAAAMACQSALSLIESAEGYKYVMN